MKTHRSLNIMNSNEGRQPQTVAEIRILTHRGKSICGAGHSICIWFARNEPQVGDVLEMYYPVDHHTGSQDRRVSLRVIKRRLCCTYPPHNQKYSGIPTNTNVWGCPRMIIDCVPEAKKSIKGVTALIAYHRKNDAAGSQAAK